MPIQIENPFRGSPVGWTWDQHRAAGYAGGTDYIFYPSDGDITAAAAGRVTYGAGQNGFTPGNAIILTLADGRQINYREVASILAKNGAVVARGQSIGRANKAGRWPHIDAVVGGVRVPFEPLVNTSTSIAGTGTVIPITGEEMSSLELVKGANDPTGAIYFSVDRASRYHLSTQAILNDYSAYITGCKNSGNTLANPDVQVVASLESFGPIVPSAVTTDTPVAIDYAALVKAVNDDAAKRLAS